MYGRFSGNRRQCSQLDFGCSNLPDEKQLTVVIVPVTSLSKDLAKWNARVAEDRRRWPAVAAKASVGYPNDACLGVTGFDCLID